MVEATTELKPDTSVCVCRLVHSHCANVLILAEKIHYWQHEHVNGFTIERISSTTNNGQQDWKCEVNVFVMFDSFKHTDFQQRGELYIMLNSG